MRYFLVTICCLFVCINTFSQTWSPVGNGVNGRVSSFTIYNGELYVGGQFSNPSGVSPYGLLKWNGINFDTLPGNYLFGSHRIEALCVYNNELYVGGSFSPYSSNGPSIFRNIARWNGTSWDSVGNGLQNVVYSMTTYNGSLYAGGDFDMSGTIPLEQIGKWDGIQWSYLGNIFIGSGGRVNELTVFNNELYLGGGFGFPSLNSGNIAIWNDTIWKNAGTGGINSHLYSMCTYNNNLIAGGLGFDQAGGSLINGIAAWDGNNWLPVGNNIGNPYGQLHTMVEYQNDLYAGGDFNILDGDSLNSIARYNNGAWISMGTGVDSTNIISDTLIFGWDTIYYYAPHRVYAFQEFNGELYVGGEFNMIGGITAHSIAKWNVPVGLAETNELESLNIYPNPVLNKINLKYPFNNLNNSIEIFDSRGQQVYYSPSFNSTSIDVSRLPNGIYLLKYSNDENSIQKSFVVSR